MSYGAEHGAPRPDNPEPDNLVQRLRDASWDSPHYVDIRREAADRIEQLEAAYVPDGWEVDLNYRLEQQMAALRAERDAEAALADQLADALLIEARSNEAEYGHHDSYGTGPALDAWRTRRRTKNESEQP
ncbi:MAG TPA: hypothetical protein VGE43_19555 [Acidimicrobiales bacterium]